MVARSYSSEVRLGRKSEFPVLTFPELCFRGFMFACRMDIQPNTASSVSLDSTSRSPTERTNFGYWHTVSKDQGHAPSVMVTGELRNLIVPKHRNHFVAWGNEELTERGKKD